MESSAAELQRQLANEVQLAQLQPQDTPPAAPPPPMSDTGADAGSEVPPVNPRKRKKASRACDFCHVNHQPCDNGKPKCSVCQKHNKSCLYLRPTKRRGPQKGYRTALNTYKESAAAWGAVLSAIPGLDALIEGHLRGNAGKCVVSSIKDASQQDALISKWQESSVFRAFFGHNGAPEAGARAAVSGQGNNSSAIKSQQDADADADADADEDDAAEDIDDSPAIRPAPAKRQNSSSSFTAQQRSQFTSSSFASLAAATAAAVDSRKQPSPQTVDPVAALFGHRESTSLSDIVARDAARASLRASQTLVPLGFAPGETIADFYSMGSNPDPFSPQNDQEFFDPALGTESEQRAYYELLMGRSFS
ncbi:hypothetical protein QBC46DRAFT_121891 [Diplogelasinospora grovesii]|uniref:Zn(2)-C6 fungal-type domain-containing protein n=1 Tax=Diplogelasinospora grovesii TaxID=303347 RepID=A0AAN6S502_9PEZI|nr:hypothetical protein QBC46DRAFT_121891 [Diplogelasinospora grovesii]